MLPVLMNILYTGCCSHFKNGGTEAKSCSILPKITYMTINIRVKIQTKVTFTSKSVLFPLNIMEISLFSSIKTMIHVNFFCQAFVKALLNFKYELFITFFVLPSEKVN